MKLQKQSVGKVGGKEYHKFVIVVPNDLVEKAGLKEGQELEGEAKEGEIKVRVRGK